MKTTYFEKAYTFDAAYKLKIITIWAGFRKPI
jgi:hypothetical protein